MKSRSQKNIKSSRTGGFLSYFRKKSVKKHPYSPITQFSEQDLNQNRDKIIINISNSLKEYLDMMKIKLSPIKESFAQFHKNKLNTEKKIKIENPFNNLFKRFWSITDVCESFQRYYNEKIINLEKIMESKFLSIDHQKLNYILKILHNVKKEIYFIFNRCIYIEDLLGPISDNPNYKNYFDKDLPKSIQKSDPKDLKLIIEKSRNYYISNFEYSYHNFINEINNIHKIIKEAINTIEILLPLLQKI